eukprot:3675036-Prymnesium_polylepis.1
MILGSGIRIVLMKMRRRLPAAPEGRRAPKARLRRAASTRLYRTARRQPLSRVESSRRKSRTVFESRSDHVAPASAVTFGLA